MLTVQSVCMVMMMVMMIMLDPHHCCLHLVQMMRTTPLDGGGGGGGPGAPPPPPPKSSFMVNLVAQERSSVDAKLMSQFLNASLEVYSYISVPVIDDDNMTVFMGSTRHL